MLGLDPHIADTQVSEKAFLQLRLDPETPILIPMDAIQEVLTIPTQRLTLVPNMPTCVLGLLHQRSHLYWAIDLAGFLKRGTIDIRNEQHNIALLNPQFSSLGLVIYGIDGVLRVPIETIEPPLQSMQNRFTGYLDAACITEEWALPVLDPKAIATDPRFVVTSSF